MMKGFTLIELLIVIIIIAILATLALPQYQKMVNRAKWAECLQLASAIKSAANLYYAVYGNSTAWPGNISEMNTLTLPATANRNFTFSLRTAGVIYGLHETASANDDFASPGSNAFFKLDLNTNATSYGNNAPGNLK